jgi:oxygen-independent coproporphyrinogen-3 oxidase
MYFAGIELLRSHGVEQYEISNFARPGYESRHNLKYWRCEEYLGFGPAAYSCFGGERFGNSRDVRAFIEGKDILCERERIGEDDAREEYVMLGLRLSEGIGRSVYREAFGRDLDADYGAALSRYLPSGHVARTRDGYRLTPLGMYVSNTILSDVLTLAEN